MSIPASERSTRIASSPSAPGQQAAVDAMSALAESWAEAARAFSPYGAPAFPLMPVVPSEVVDRFFDTAAQMLEVQRSLVHSVVGAFSAFTTVPGAAQASR